MVSIPWRTGVNMREFAYYGQGGLPNFFAPAPLQRLQAEALRQIGVKLVRFFASQRSTSAQDSANRVRAACDVLAANGMQAIICLDDALGVAGWCVPGYDQLHNQVNGQYHKSFFTQDLWRTQYLPHISAIVAAVREHPGALLFELGNEYAFHPRVPEPNRADADAFIRFTRVVSETIKSIAPTKLVSTGLVNTRHIANLAEENPPVTVARQLYGLPSIDAVSVHYYQHDNERDNLANDVNMAKTLGKPFYVGEFGAEFGKVDRLAYYQNELQSWRSAGAFTAMAWAFDTSPNDVGVSDIYSFARIKGDFDGLLNLYRGFAADVQPFSLPAKESDVGSGAVSGSGSLAGDKTDSSASGSSGSGMTTTGTGAFTLQYPMTWEYVVRAKFDDAAQYGGNFVQKREGILFAPAAAGAVLSVLAAQRGRVSRVENYPPGYGKYVCIEHKWGADTFVTWYGHLDSINVKVNDNVTAGQQIGVAGRSGSADEISLFFTVQYLGKGGRGYIVNDVVDPLRFLVQAIAAHDESTLDAHVTIPDGTPFQPGAFFKKTWRVRNTGSKAWEGYTLAFFSGDAMGPGTAVPVPTTPPGSTVQLSVDLVAPQTTGTQRSTWRLKNAAGEFFPADLNAQIIVQPREQGTRRPLARFVADVTIPDRTKIKPGTQFTKTWRILNDGNTVWDNTYKLVFERDEQMGAPASVALPPLRPRQSGDVSVTFTAPAKTGILRSTWQPTDPDGMPFDFEMYVEIDVDPTAGDPPPLNTQNVFASPVQGNYRIGWRFNDPVNYGDGKHKGVDYVSPTAGNAIVAAGDGIVFSAERCGICTPDRPNWTSHGLTIAAATAQGLFSRPSQWNFGFGSLLIVRYAWNNLPIRARQTMSARGYENGFAYVFYAHLQDIFVTNGARVTAGQQIATLGNSGNSTAPHLHLEIRLGRDTRDYTRPIQLLNPEDIFSL